MKKDELVAGLTYAAEKLADGKMVTAEWHDADAEAMRSLLSDVRLGAAMHNWLIEYRPVIQILQEEVDASMRNPFRKDAMKRALADLQSIGNLHALEAEAKPHECQHEAVGSDG